MNLDAWLTLGVVAAAVTVMVTERAPAAYVLLAATIALSVAGVISTQEAFAGFSNPAPITVAALYVLAAAAHKTGLLDRLPRLLDTDCDGRTGQFLRIFAPTALASSILNNTPVVAMVAPTVLARARRANRPPSKYLIPISFAAILGGLVTLVGTSTNLVVSGLLEASGHAPMTLFEIGRVGLPVAVAGLAYLALASRFLLPERRTPGQDLQADARECTVEMVIAPQSPLIGKTIVSGGLRNLEGVFLVELDRRGQQIAPVSPEETLEEADRLIFAGNVSRILDLQRFPGLRSAEERHFPRTGSGRHLRFYEAVVAEGSALAASTLKQIGFRARYGAAVVAIHRAGERITAKLGQVILRPGDLLILLADQDFNTRSGAYHDFLVVAPTTDDTTPRRDQQGLVMAVLVGLLLVIGLQILDIVRASLLAAIAVVMFRVLTPADVRRAIDAGVLIIIASSFGVGTAIATTGLDQQIASHLILPLGQWGDTALLVGVLVATVCVTELVTNTAAAVLMYPIALATAAQAGLDPRGLAMAVALGASASFLSPIGYQTNTMVYAMGGYRFTDFARAGWPLTLITIVAAALLIPIAWPLR